MPHKVPKAKALHRTPPLVINREAKQTDLAGYKACELLLNFSKVCTHFV